MSSLQQQRKLQNSEGVRKRKIAKTGQNEAESSRTDASAAQMGITGANGARNGGEGHTK